MTENGKPLFILKANIDASLSCVTPILANNHSAWSSDYDDQTMMQHLKKCGQEFFRLQNIKRVAARLDLSAAVWTQLESLKTQRRAPWSYSIHVVKFAL